MQIPNNYTELEVITIIDKVVHNLAAAFRFGHYDIEDMKQEGRIAALEILHKYDDSRGPLENFLYVHVRNSYMNLRRKKLRRSETPCRTCPFFDPQCKKSTNKCGIFADKMECDKFNSWTKRNDDKANIMEPTNLANITVTEKSVQQQSDVIESVEIRELQNKIDTELPVKLRGDYLKMKAGVSVPKAKRLKVEEACKKIIKDALDA